MNIFLASKGSNLISVTTEDDTEMSQCQQKGLYHDIDILKNYVKVATQQTKGKYEWGENVF